MAPANTSHELRRVRIAVAEDEVELRDYWHEILPHLGYQLVGIVSSGEELIRLCRQIPPDVIITDAYFDGLSGVDAVTTICRERCVGVVFITGRQHEDEAMRAEAGAVILAKPFTIEQLKPAIETAFRQGQQRTDVP